MVFKIVGEKIFKKKVESKSLFDPSSEIISDLSFKEIFSLIEQWKIIINAEIKHKV
jgi:hypothetical protein